MTRSDRNDVLEQNVSTLLESGGEPPMIADAARARIRAELIAKHGVAEVVTRRARVPLLAVGIGLAATVATALVVSHFVGGETAVRDGHTLADGSTYVTKDGGTVTVIGPRRVRVEGAALLDVAPGKGTFVVETSGGRIEVLGTRFVVDAAPNKTFTAVVRGEVKLASDQGAVVLHAGEQAVAEPGRAPVRGPAPRLSHLVSWAQSARHREEGSLEPARHGSLFARDPGMRPNGQFGEEYPLPLAKLAVDVVVEDQVARVALDQTFHNPQPRVLEGVYKFAIPPDAALQRLAMYVDGKLTESAVVERMRARRIYEELVYRRIDPALLEYAGTGRLNLRVYPLPANQDKRLMVAYTQSLPKLYKDWTLAIPLPEVDQPVGEMTVSARIKGCANCELSSPSHHIDVARSGEDAVVTYHRNGDKIGDTFVVHVRDARQQTTVAQLADGNDRYLMVRAPIDLGSDSREYRPRTWVILDDVSASRSALELRAQADLVDAFVRELDEQDKVAVIAFDVEARQKLAPTRVLDVDRRVVRQALKGEGGVGATDFDKALAAATRLLDGVNPDDAMIVYLGDGVITSGPRQLDVLRGKLAGKAHFVGVGVGDGPDTQTLGALAAATGGYAATFDLSDDLGWRAFDLIAALHTSRITGVTARLVDEAGQLVPATAYLASPQLADGEELQLVAKLAGSGTPAAVQLSGMRGATPWQQTVKLGAGMSGAGYLPRLWAQQHIAARLLAKHEPVVVPPCTPQAATRTAAAVACPTEAELREKRDEEIRQEIVTLGKQYFLLSRHTSLLVLENDAMYAQYGVRKGAGDTWAPYALPATIPVVTSASTVLPSDVADDAELVREPLQLFADTGYDDGWSRDEDVAGADWGTIGLGRFGGIGHGSGTGSGYGIGGGRGGMRGRGAREETVADTTRATLGLVPAQSQHAQPDTVAAWTESRLDDDVGTLGRLVNDPALAGERGGFDLAEGKMGKFVADKAKAAMPLKKASISTGDFQRANGFLDGRSHWSTPVTRRYRSYGAGPLVPARLTYPSDMAFDDVTAFVPALVPDAFDDWRAELRDGAARRPLSIDAGASRLLAEARDKLPSGIYQWAGRELLVDHSRRVGWRRTTETGLVEIASFDGMSYVRRYPELGLTTTRKADADGVAFSLAYLPILIASPGLYTQFFEVKARGADDITLSRRVNGTLEVAFVLTFDTSAHLVAISNGQGEKLLEVTWTNGVPTAARAGGDDIAVGFHPDPSSATAWADAAVAPVTVELPTRVPTYWQAQLEKERVGTPGWRHVQRQRMATAASLGDRRTLFLIYDELVHAGGVELGDLALASGGIATATTDAQFGQALAVRSIAATPLARYLVAGRAYGKAPRAARMKPETVDGVVGALWSVRYAEATAQDSGASYGYTANTSSSKGTADAVLAIDARAPVLRLLGVAALSQSYVIKPEDAARMWDAVAIGDIKNLAQAQAVQMLTNRGAYDLAAERFAKLAAELDLSAPPPAYNFASYSFSYSRRGPAGFQLAYAMLRDRVLAGRSFAHVMALLPLASQRTGDVQLVLARATALAAGDDERTRQVIRAANRYGQQATAQALVEPLLKSSPTRELYQLAAQMAQGQSRPADALTYLEKAQEAGANEAVDLGTVRGELTQIIALAQQVALASQGAAREQAVNRALAWAGKWRMIDPGNADIDRQVGNLLLAIGDSAGAWRQLSSTIERDPWSSAGYTTVADAFEQQGKVGDALELWQQAIVIDQTNPTPRLRKAQALYALGRAQEADALLAQITKQKWHVMWQGVVYQAQNLLDRGKQSTR